MVCQEFMLSFKAALMAILEAHNDTWRLQPSPAPLTRARKLSPIDQAPLFGGDGGGNQALP